MKNNTCVGLAPQQELPLARCKISNRSNGFKRSPSLATTKNMILQVSSPAIRKRAARVHSHKVLQVAYGAAEHTTPAMGAITIWPLRKSFVARGFDVLVFELFADGHMECLPSHLAINSADSSNWQSPQALLDGSKVPQINKTPCRA